MEKKDISNDISSSLDYILIDKQIENKFQSLKLLHLKKIKLLMTTINTQEKEINKLKILSKDNRRTQMIQSLKKKLKDQEYISEILKDELNKKNEITREEINDYIIRKSISGPKRFRPLTREELEQQIIDLEKKVKTKSSSSSQQQQQQQLLTGSNGSISGGNGDNNGNNIERKIPQKDLTLQNGSINGKRSNQNLTTSQTINESKDDTQYLAKISDLQNELLELQQTCDRRDNTIIQLKDEINRLRAVNSQLLAVEEERNIIERQYNNLTLQHERIIEELEELLHQNGILQEESHQLRSEYEIEVENLTLEINVLKEQSEKGLKQNTQLLRHMSEIESQIDKKKRDGFNELSMTATSDSYNLNNIQNEKLKLANQKIQLLEAQLKSTSQNTNESQSEINILKATLREKNEVIRELKRNLNEVNRLKGSAKDTSPTSSPNNRLNSRNNFNNTNSYNNGNSNEKEQLVTLLCDSLLTYEMNITPSNSSSNKLTPQIILNLMKSLQQLKKYYTSSTSSSNSNNSNNNNQIITLKKLHLFEHTLLMRHSEIINEQNEEDDDEELNGINIR